MSGATDWSRAHAVVVAIEQYAGGRDWELSGPANDAARLLRWFTDRGMPQEQIRLLASPLERNEGLLAPFPRVDRRPADRGTLRRVFQDELSALAGEWLWIYWAGHGVQAQGNRWSLLYPESRTGDPLGLDADNLVSLLRTEHLPVRDLPRATVIIDACRTALPARDHAHSTPPDLLTHSPETNRDRRIFVMRASQSGTAAKNRDGSGLFTSRLLDRLEETTRHGLPVDLDDTWSSLRADFARLHATGAARQIPTVHVVNWEENAYEYIPLSLPEDPAQRRARAELTLATKAVLEGVGASAHRVAKRLCEELDAVPPAAEGDVHVADMVAWALTSPHGVPTLIHLLTLERGEMMDRDEMRRASLSLAPDRWLLCSEYHELLRLLTDESPTVHQRFAEAARQAVPGIDLPDATPAVVVDELEARLLDPGRLPQLLRAVEHTAAALPGRIAPALRSWSLRCAERIDMKAVLLDRRAEAEEQAERAPAGATDSVQISVSSGSGPDAKRTYQVWTRGRHGTELLAVEDSPRELPAVIREVDTLLSRHATARQTLVEFFLAPTDLELQVHRWEIGAAGPVERSIGTDFPVVVRCAEHRSFNEPLWRERWSRVASAGTADLHWLPGHLRNTRQVYGELQAREEAPGVVVTAPPEARAEVFTACLFGGVPVMLWNGGAEQPVGREQLETLVADRLLEELPGELRRLRSACDADDDHPGRHLALLWDNPERPLPPRLDLSAP
ncbi:caspase family protein [Streptomyces sp. TRM49041]|uniref:VMAP-C domain-containing protein n=1 Tax=Streptomyces sp. TRM49041 TaxID=2603216 RepID=UPI0011F048FA|nr:caspase family protein [Streptomyces sp. TRM49041]